MASAAATKKPPATPYFHNGQALASPPLSVRVRRHLVDAYCFVGLYLTTLFSFDPATAAQASPFSIRNQSPDARRQAKFPPLPFGGFGGGGGGGGGGPGGGGSGPRGGGGGGGKRLGTVDQVRGPECGSCG